MGAPLTDWSYRVRNAIRQFIFGVDGKAGAALVEFAIAAPMLIVIFTYLTDAVILALRQTEVQHAAAAGAQYAIYHTCSSPSCSSTFSTALSNAVTNANPTYRAISATPAPSFFCGCPTTSGVTNIGSLASSNVCQASKCTSSCGGGATLGAYITVSAQATFTNLFISGSHTLSASATVLCGYVPTG